MIAGRRAALACLTVLDAPPPQIVAIAAEAGFDAVTLRILDASSRQENPLASDTPIRRRTIAELESREMQVLDVEVLRLHAGTNLDALQPVWESAAMLGAENVLVIDNEPEEQRFVEVMRRLCEDLAEYEMRAALEFMAFTECKTVGQAMRIVEASEHPAAAVLVDPLHLDRSGGSPAQVKRLAAAHQERFPYAQLCDATSVPKEHGSAGLYREAVSNRLHPGEGELPLRDLIDALPPATPLSVETPVARLAALPPSERARQAIEHTRRLLLR